MEDLFKTYLPLQFGRKASWHICSFEYLVCLQGREALASQALGAALSCEQISFEKDGSGGLENVLRTGGRVTA